VPAPQASTPAVPSNADADFARPAGIDGGFAERPIPPRYSPPPPTVSPEDQAVFGRPSPDAAFAPAPGERLAPRAGERPAVAPVFRDTFSAPGGARDGFAPAPGDRVDPRGPQPESPWWKADAPRDPWRDPTADFWLGRGAVFTRGRPTQLDPASDSEAEDIEYLGDEEPGAEPDESETGVVRRGRFGLPALGVVVLVTLVAGLVGGGAGWFLTKKTDDALHRPDVKIAQVDTPTTRKPGSVASVAKRVGPAVVSILVQTSDEFAIGSGVVIDSDGDILTNNHVVSAAAEDKGSIVVTFSDEATAKAQIVGRDPVSDLAVIKVPNDKLTVAQLGDSDKLAVGDPVIAIGSPLGLQGTVTAGIVSALNRPVHVSNDDGSSDAYLDAIQTDAPINPGNSGGALVNSGGAVVGINSAGALGTVGQGGTTTAISGIGYAIPIDYARTIALQLIHTGKATHASLGATGSTAVAGLQVGAYLKQVSPGGAAAKAGLKPGDVIVVADGTVVQTFDQLVVIVQQHKPGEKIVVQYYRNKSSTKSTTTVTLG